MAKFELLKTLNIELPNQTYPIYFCVNGVRTSELLKRHIVGDKVFIVTDQNVAPHYLEKLILELDSYQCNSLILPGGETHKNQQSLFLIYEELIKKHHSRDTTIIALGGGVIGDLTGFAASTYLRGVPFIQIPTTLLAQVDASVGGKTAINHPLGKNMIGSFYHPTAVIIDFNTLKTLPERDFTAGMAEIIKYAFLEGGVFLSQVEDYLAHKNDLDHAKNLGELIQLSCAVKIDYVIEDEKEKGSRALLNLGHTLGHALESYTNYQRWLHGEAVAIGLYFSAVLSHILGYLPSKYVRSLELLIQQANLVSRIPKDIDLKSLYRLMLSDKKVLNQQLRFILMKEPGQCFIESSVAKEKVEVALIKSIEGEEL